MKKYLPKFITTAVFVLFFVAGSVAQPPLPPGHEGGDDYTPAPVGAGLVILLGLAGVYGAKKVYNARKRLQ